MKKKILLTMMLCASVFSFAKMMAIWTSTCGMSHHTTFPDGWSYGQMGDWIAGQNYSECGVEVTVTIHP